MAFTSASFIVLTIASVLLYYIVPKKAQWCILLLASAAFYMAGSVKAFAWVVLVAGMTWVTGLILGRYNAIKPADKAQKAQIQHKKKQIAIICAVCCFGLLYAMKYWNFTLELLPSALGNHIPRWDFVVPLGLSFFIFQSMSYVIDVYRGKYAPERNPLRYGLFVSFFPQMVQGPISRFDQLAPQLTAERKLCWDDLQIGIQLALWGYFKKIVIADRAAVLVNNVIMENCPYGGAVIAFYPLAFSKPFGKLGKWARKHFKGMMGKICATSTATFIVYLIIGIWHGANFRYIAFGLWNGILITASLLMERRFLSWKEKLHINDKSTGWRIFMTVRTFGLVFIGRYFTRAPRLKTVFTLLGTTVLHPHFSEFTSVVPTLGLGISDFIIIFVGILIVHGVEFFEERGTDVQTWLNERPALMQLTVLTVSLVVLLLFGIFRAGYISSEFIYKQF